MSLHVPGPSQEGPESLADTVFPVIAALDDSTPRDLNRISLSRPEPMNHREWTYLITDGPQTINANAGVRQKVSDPFPVRSDTAIQVYRTASLRHRKSLIGAFPTRLSEEFSRRDGLSGSDDMWQQEELVDICRPLAS